MHRPLRFLLVAAALATSACSESQLSGPDRATGPAIAPFRPSTPASVVFTCPTVSQAQKSIDSLLPQIFGPGGGRRGKAQGYSNSIDKARRDGSPQLAQTYVDSLINYTLQNYYANNLIGGQSPTTQDRVLQFFYLLYCANGITPIPDLSGIFGAENSVLIRNTTPTTVVSDPDKNAAVKVDLHDVPSTLDGQPFFGTFVSVFKTTAPLPTSLDWYGNDGYKAGAFEFVTNPVVTFDDPVLTGACINYDDVAVDDPKDLRLAHQVEVGYTPVVPGNSVLTTAGGTIEIGAGVSTAPLGLSCTQLPFAAGTLLGRWLQQFAGLVLPGQLFAGTSGGSTGSQVVKFSPFAAVDTKLNTTSMGPSSPAYIPSGSTEISAPVEVTVKTRKGATPISGIPVTFAPGTSFSSASVLTNASGTAGSMWTLVAGTNAATGTPAQAPLKFKDSPANFSVEAIQILPVVVTTLPAPPGGTVDVSYSFTFAATGGIGTFTWSKVSGVLPTGLTLSAAGALSGTPTTAGSFTFTVRATSGPTGLEATGDATFTVVISTPPVNITTTSLPTAFRGVPYTASLSATGGDGGYVWSISAGSLPAGLSLSGNTISGTPTGSAVTATFTVQATSNGTSDTQSLTLTVGATTAIVLTFDQGPSKSACYQIGAPMTPGIRVKVRDQSGNLLSGVAVNMVAVTNNGSKVEVSPSSVNSSGGFASFGGPSINKTGGYALIASTGAPWPVASVTSTKFNISPSCP